MENGHQITIEVNEELEREIKRLSRFLHAREIHPDYEYATTHGPRKAFSEDPPDGDGWERNTSKGYNGWERFDYHEEAYWLRRRAPHGLR